MYDVCLVSMPYGAIERPSIGIGLLIAGAKEAGLCARAIYATFWFAEQIGLPTYRVLSEAGDVADLIGEWTFSQAAFPDFQTNDEEYLSRVLSKDFYNALSYSSYLGDTDLCALLRRVRDSARDFVAVTAERILELNPKIVGCSSVFQQHCSSLALLRKIKTLNPNVVTLLGGANCEGSMGRVVQARFPWVDYVVSGEADLFFPNFCKTLLDHGNQVIDGMLPYGVMPSSSRRSRTLFSVEMVDKPPRAFVRELDQIPVPDYDDFFEQLNTFRSKDLINPGLLLETSRGCWWGAKHHCTFCGLNGELLFFRSKTPQRVSEELRKLSERYGLTLFEVVDNILDMKFFKTLLADLARSEYGYTLFYETKANLDEQHLKTLAAARVRWIQPGIESLHDEILRMINKGNTTLGNVMLLKFALENGIRVSWNLLFGVPGERDEWYDEMASWMPLIAHLQPPSSLVRIRYDRFSPYHVDPTRYGIASLSPNRAYAAVYPLEERDLIEMAYFFEDYTDSTRGRIDKPAVGRVKDWLLKWNKLFAGPERPELVMVEGEKGTLIWDSRPEARESLIVLDGLAHRVHRACRTPWSSESLLSKLNSESDSVVESSELDEAKQYLIDMGLLLCLNGRLLSLATRVPNESLLTMSQFPGGFYRAAEWES